MAFRNPPIPRMHSTLSSSSLPATPSANGVFQSALVSTCKHADGRTASSERFAAPICASSDGGAQGTTLSTRTLFFNNQLAQRPLNSQILLTPCENCVLRTLRYFPSFRRKPSSSKYWARADSHLATLFQMFNGKSFARCNSIRRSLALAGFFSVREATLPKPSSD